MFIKLDEDNYISETLFMANGEYPEGFFEVEEVPEAIDDYKHIDGVFVHEPRAPVASDQNDINREALSYLAETDWYLIRKFETGVAVPQEVLIKRQEAREAITEG